MAMRNTNLTVYVLLLALFAAGCNSILGDDMSPETISYQIQGDAGFPVQVVVSREFVAGVTETGVTQVSVFASDTAQTVLPVQGDLDVSAQRRFYIEVLPLDTQNTLTGRVIISVDGRNLYNQQGDILPDPPFRFVYVFNQATTSIIEVF